MPKLEIYDAQTAPNAQLRTNRASGDDFGAGMGRGLQRAGDALQVKAEKDAAFWAEKTLARARGDWAQRMKDLQESAELGAPGFTDSVTEQFDNYRDEILEQAPTARSRQRLNADMERLRSTLTGQAVGFEAASAANARISAAQETLTTNVNTVRAEPQMLDDSLDQDARMIEALDLPAEEREKLKTNQRYALAFAAGNGRLDRVEEVEDAIAFADELRGGDTWKSRLTETDYSRLLGRADAVIKQLRGQERQSVVEGLKDAIPEMENGIGLDQAGHWVEQISMVIEDPKERQQLTDRVHRAARLGSAHNVVGTADWDELPGIVESFDARVQTPGEFRLDVHDRKALGEAIDRRNQALSDDAASYVLNTSETVAKAHQRLLDARQAGAEDPGAIPEAAHEYAVAMAAEQGRLRGPFAQPNLLTRTEMATIAAGLSAVERTPEGAQQAHQVLMDQAHTWGRHWPEVYRQLQQGKVIDGVEAVAARLTRPDQAVTGRTLMQAAYIGANDLWKQTGQPDGVRGDLRRSVTEQLAEFKASTDPQTGGDRAYANHAEAVELLATHYMSRGEQSAANAVRRAAEEVLLRDYEFRETWRMPVTAGVSVRDVSRGANSLRESIGEMDFVVPESWSGLNEVDTRNAAVSVLEDRGTWITNRDETGLQFVVEEMNGEMSPVLQRDGGQLMPIEFTWEELVERVPETPPAPDLPEMSPL